MSLWILDTYIGSVEKHTQTLWILDANAELVHRQFSYFPGLYKIFDEILVNAADNKQRDPNMDSLKVVIDVDRNLISVFNNGDGIPEEVHKEEGVYVPEMIFGHLLTSSNYDDDVKKTTGGRNDFGAKLINIFSTVFTIETADGRRQKKYKQLFSNNMGKKSMPIISECKESENWTKVSFKPDLEKFRMTRLEDDVVGLMRKRVFDIAGCLGKTVKVDLNGQRVPVKSFKDYVNLYLQSASKSKPEPLPRFLERVNDRWELVGLGIANVCGSLFLSYPSTGSFSRSAMSHESGAKSGVSGVVTGITIGCALLFLTPLFTDIPQCALAAIVISAVMGLVDYPEAIFLWRVDKKDFLLWAITFIATLFLGIEIGVLIGVGVSLAFVIHESANPHIAILGRLPGTTVYRNLQQYPEAYTYHGIVIVRIDSPMYFANTSYIKDRLREYELNNDRSTRRGPEVERVYFVIIEMAPVTYVDSSAVQALKDLHQEYKLRDIQIAVSNPNREVLLTLTKSGIVDLIGKEWFFVRVHDAVQVCLQLVQSLNEMPKKNEASPPEDKPSFFQRLLQRYGQDMRSPELESGQVRSPADPKLEPLLSRKR